MKVPNVRYLVVGDGDDRPYLADLARRQSVADRVIFAGTVDSATREALYHLADCFAMPSTDEGFGFVYLEALRAGLTVVALDAAGAKDALAHSRHSLLVPVNDDEALVSALTAGLCRENKDACKEDALPSIGKFSRLRFAEHFSAILNECEQAA
jgi:glycosyltransferase involved in cell wall biosynthesis